MLLPYSVPNIRHHRALPERDISLPYMQCSGICFFPAVDRVEKAWSGGPGYRQAVCKGLGDVRAPPEQP